MEAQQEPNIFAPAMEEDHVQSSGKAKLGVLSKVKHKARKLKDKVKKVTHSGHSTHDDDKHGHVQTERDRDQAGLRPALAHEDKNVVGDSSDESDYDSEEQEDYPNDSQMKYERLPSIGASDKQGDGSDVEHHDGIPATAALNGAYWKSDRDDSPVSIYKSAGPPGALQATPTEYHNYAAINDDQSFEGCPDKAPKAKPPSSEGLDVASPSPGNLDLDRDRDQIGIYSEDLSADRKLGIGNASGNRRDSGEAMSMSARDSSKHVGDGGEDMSMSARDTSTHLGCESPTPGPVDGAHEQLYKPVAEPDNFPTSLTSESINASLYGDVLAAEDKLTKGARVGGDGYPSDQSEEEFSFDKENLPKQPTEMMLGSKPENREDDAAPQDKASVVDGNEAQEASRSVEGQGASIADGVEGEEASRTTEGWGKWSADKLNNAVDGLALKLGGGGTTERDALVSEKNDSSITRETSNVSYFDPNDLRDNKFQEQFTLGTTEFSDGDDTLLDGALAGSAAIVEKLTELKDSVASTLGFGGSETPSTPSGAPHADSDEYSSKRRSTDSSGGGKQGSSKDEDDQQQTSFLQGLKETVGSAFGTGNVSPQLESSKQPEPIKEQPAVPHSAGTDPNVEPGKKEELSHAWSLDSASDVPQAAFL